MAQKITDANYKELLAQDKLVVVDIWAEWYGPCRSLAPAVDDLAAEFEGKAIIGKYNVDDDNALSSEMGIRNIPTLLFFKGGKLVDKQVGASSKAHLKASIEAIL